MNRRRRALTALVAGLALVTGGCATVPQETQPQAIGVEGVQQVQEERQEEGPAKGMSAADIVRQFVYANAEPVNRNQASRLYLDPRDRKRWAPGTSLIILEDSFAAIAASDAEQPADKNLIKVKLRGQLIGTLGSDNAFTPSEGPYLQEFTLQRQPDGQWRIRNAPESLITTKSEFTENFQRVSLYYYASGSTEVLVPDLRYVQRKPQPALPSRVVSLLLDGPSVALRGAVDDALATASTDTNVTTTSDGALAVPLTGIGEDSALRDRIGTQIVMSLRGVTPSRIRLLVDGAPLSRSRRDWQSSDLRSYEALISPGADAPGMKLVDERLYFLNNGQAVAGPTGTGRYRLVSAAQSVPGGQLALVERSGRGVRMLIGPLSSEAQSVDLKGRTLTRPTWRPAGQGSDISNEAWTVKDGKQVLRVVLTLNGSWKPQRVNIDELQLPPGRITALRLSRDGTRAAIVVGGKVVVASVVRSPESVKLSGQKVLQPSVLNDVVDVDWQTQDALIVASSSSSRPVVRVGVDGFRMDPYNRSNLTPPIYAVTAAPGQSVIAADEGGLWTATDIGALWRPHARTGGLGAVPFYPG